MTLLSNDNLEKWNLENSNLIVVAYRLGCDCMVELDSQQIIEYFQRCYKAVDGLWFMKVEKQYGFDRALDVDNEVWKVMPKIQARIIKSMLKLSDGPDALFIGLKTKLELDGFKFKAEKTENGFRITINDCPWHNLMIKSGRETLLVYRCPKLK